MQLDLTEYWLMQWQYAALLSLVGWFAQHFSNMKFEQRYPGAVLRVENSFSFIFLCKQLGLTPGNNKLAAYFISYVIVFCCNFQWSFTIHTLAYWYLVSKMLMDPDWLNFVWVFFFRWAPLHPYLYSLLLLDSIKTATQFLMVQARTKALLNSILFLANGFIIMQSEINNLYMPLLWRITVSGWEYVFSIERIILATLISNNRILQFFGWFSFFIVRTSVFWSIATPVLKKIQLDDENLQRAAYTFLQTVQPYRPERWLHLTSLNAQKLIDLENLESLSSGASQSSSYCTQDPTVPSLQSASSDDEPETGYRVGKHLLRSRQPFVRKMQYMHDAFELPGYNEEEDSTYVDSQATEESDSESSEEDLSRAEFDQYKQP